MTTQSEAIRCANAEIKAGNAIQHVMINGQLHVQTDQGWRVVWPVEDELAGNPNTDTFDY